MRFSANVDTRWPAIYLSCYFKLRRGSFLANCSPFLLLLLVLVRHLSNLALHVLRKSKRLLVQELYLNLYMVLQQKLSSFKWPLNFQPVSSSLDARKSRIKEAIVKSHYQNKKIQKKKVTSPSINSEKQPLRVQLTNIVY